MNHSRLLFACAALSASVMWLNISFSKQRPTTESVAAIVNRNANDALTALDSYVEQQRALTVTFSSVDLVNQDELSNYCDATAFTIAGRWYTLKVEPGDGVDVFRRTLELTYHPPSDGVFSGQKTVDNLGAAGLDRIRRELVEHLQIDPTITKETRAVELKKLRAEMERLHRIHLTLNAMVAANGEGDAATLENKIRALLEMRTKLRNDLHDKLIRNSALMNERMRLVAKLDKDRETDLVVLQLQKLVELHKQSLAEVQKQVDAGVTEHIKLVEAQTARTEAEIQLAERQAAVVSSSTMSSLEQIDAEMSRINIDGAELETHLNEVEKKLAPYDMATATTQSITAASDLLATADNGHAHELLAQNERDQADLMVKILRMEIIKIEATSASMPSG